MKSEARKELESAPARRALDELRALRKALSKQTEAIRESKKELEMHCRDQKGVWALPSAKVLAYCEDK